MKRLKDKIAIVTGSSSGIGKAIALRFGQEGATVVVAARRLYKCEETVAQIEAAGGTAVPLQVDVADESQVERLIGETVRRFQRLDILVNNAGIFGGRRLADTSTEAFDEVMNTNVRGTFFCCRAAFAQMKKQGGGTILNMSSVAGVQAWSGTGTYSASKHAIMALSKALADEGARAPRQSERDLSRQRRRRSGRCLGGRAGTQRKNRPVRHRRDRAVPGLPGATGRRASDRGGPDRRRLVVGC
jgi:3-oxoacyl-[acyl-carrier protein] reductase